MSIVPFVPPPEEPQRRRVIPSGKRSMMESFLDLWCRRDPQVRNGALAPGLRDAFRDGYVVAEIHTESLQRDRIRRILLHIGRETRATCGKQVWTVHSGNGRTDQYEDDFTLHAVRCEQCAAYTRTP